MDEKYNVWLVIAVAILIVIITGYLVWTFKDVVTWDTEIPLP